jgi:LysM repeat protein
VRKGDTLSELARRYNVSVSAIREHNQTLADKLRPGDKLAIPVSEG